MINKMKIELAKKALGRGSSGLYFIIDILRDKKGGTDLAFSRSWYILLSFNFELILKSILILESKLDSKEKILRSIKSHNLNELSEIISKEDLEKYGIRKITTNVINSFIQYEVEIVNDKGTILIEDLIDIRYDFERENLRNVDSDEINRIKKEIKLLLSVVDKINKVLYPTA